MKEKKITVFLKNNFIYFIIVFACLSRISYGMYNIEKSGATIIEIIGSGLIIFILGTLIAKLFSLQGMLTGDRNDGVVKTNNKHAEIVDEVDPHMNHLDGWCEYKSKKGLELVRKRILNEAGLSYTDCFNENETAKDIEFSAKEFIKPKHVAILIAEFKALKGENALVNHKELIALERARCKAENRKIRHYNKKQHQKKKAFLKAIKTKITPLTPDALIINRIKINDPYNFGMDRERYQKVSFRSGLLSKAIFGLLFSYFTLVPAMYGWENLISAIVEVAIMLLMGAVSFIQAYYFVIDALRKRTVKQINHLQEFKRDIELNTYKKENEYELGLQTKISTLAKKPLVEEVHREHEPIEADNICGNTDTGV